MQSNKEVRQGREKSKEKGPSEKASPLSGLFQRVIVCFEIGVPHIKVGTSLVTQTVKCLSTMRETRVRSLCWEDPLEKEMKWQSTPVLLPGKSHGQRSLVGYM